MSVSTAADLARALNGKRSGKGWLCAVPGSRGPQPLLLDQGGSRRAAPLPLPRRLRLA